MNPTSKIFQKELDNIISKASIEDVSSLRKIKIEGETDEATSSGSSGQFSAPLFSLFSDEAPKKKKIKGGVVETDESIEDSEENLEVIFELLDDFTSGGKLYYDDETESIWMINPETKEWIFEFEKSGTLWYSYSIFTDIFKWISMEWPDFNPYITKWVERILQNEVKNTPKRWLMPSTTVERILQNEVKNTGSPEAVFLEKVERILQNEVKNTLDVRWYREPSVERILQNEVKNTHRSLGWRRRRVERILQKEVKNTGSVEGEYLAEVERILQTGTELNSEENINESVIDSEENLEVIFELLDDFTSGGKLYYDDKTDSIWMINPETKKWIFEFRKSGNLWYSYQIFTDIFKWLSMEYPDFNPYITKWVERILQKEVKHTQSLYLNRHHLVERILQKEVKHTDWADAYDEDAVERILQNEVKNTTRVQAALLSPVERILQKEVKNTFNPFFDKLAGVERILQKEVKNTIVGGNWPGKAVERILQKNDEQLIGGKSDKMSLENIAKKHNKKIGQLKKQFNMGLRIEKEHTNDEETAKEITLDHLYEDPEYYTKLNKMEKGEFKEATGAASAGQYSGPSFLAKSQIKKDWRGAAKPLYKGGKFVRVKKKCKTFPYCNQGDVKALDLWEDDKLTETIKKIAKNKRIHENVVRAIILHEIEEKLFGD